VDRQRFLTLALASALIILFLNLPILEEVAEEGTVESYPPEATGILLSLLPLSVLVIAVAALRRRPYRTLYLLMGLVFMALFWGFTASPTTIMEAQAQGQPLRPLLLYMAVGLVFLLLAVFVFRRGVEE
jgi:p-aminobenzoyl-glutamate transporter AbgT